MFYVTFSKWAKVQNEFWCFPKVIDCTEIEIENYENYEAQGHIYSNYKHRATSKILIGTNQNGAVIYISDVFEGSKSDRQCVIDSDFLEFLEPGDVVLADRGFNVEDLLLEKGATLVIPPFMKGKSNLTISDEVLTKVIAKGRIHIERFNQRFKIFSWCKGPISQIKINLMDVVI